MNMSVIEKVGADKKRFIDLLLLADEQESMIDRYLDRGELFVSHGPVKGMAFASSRILPSSRHAGERGMAVR